MVSRGGTPRHRGRTVPAPPPGKPSSASARLAGHARLPASRTACRSRTRRWAPKNMPPRAPRGAPTSGTVPCPRSSSQCCCPRSSPPCGRRACTSASGCRTWRRSPARTSGPPALPRQAHGPGNSSLGPSHCRSGPRCPRGESSRTSPGTVPLTRAPAGPSESGSFRRGGGACSAAAGSPSPSCHPSAPNSRARSGGLLNGSSGEDSAARRADRPNSAAPAADGAPSSAQTTESRMPPPRLPCLGRSCSWRRGTMKVAARTECARCTPGR
eukprot:scaffold17633_cov65-Phaeocystis_antarctica.AAC.4